MAISAGALMGKVNAYSQTPAGKKKMSDKIATRMYLPPEKHMAEERL